MEMTQKIVHVAPLHGRYDVRIFQKECSYLARNGYDVSLIVADSKGDEVKSGVSIIDVGAWKPTWKHYIVSCWHSMRRASTFDRIHFHDGIFLPFALLLAVLGKSVVYDVHEDYRSVVLSWKFHPLINRAISMAFALMESAGDHLFKAKVSATPRIAQNFRRGTRTIVQNFPELKEVVANVGPQSDRSETFCYIGGIAKRRGSQEMAIAAQLVASEVQKPVLLMAGSFVQAGTEAAMSHALADGSVKMLGHLGRSDLYALMSSTRAGLLLFHPEPNHTESQPNKLFEYMAAGLPVIASDFPHWRSIIENVGCGLLVNPLDPEAIAQAMRLILSDNHEADAMGARGRTEVLEKLNWEGQFDVLTDTYRTIGWTTQ